jgi:hypothetical protein
MSVHFGMGENAQIEGESVSGTLHFDFAKLPDASIDVQTISGDIDNCFGPKPMESKWGAESRLSFKSMDGNGHIRIQTKSGDIAFCTKDKHGAANYPSRATPRELHGRADPLQADVVSDFWYLGCIDSTLWWLIALAFLDGRPGCGALRHRYAKRIKLAVQWLLAQEHQRFYLLQQNEASDWADIMPRSGFVLYTNALWYFVKRLFGIGNRAETYDNFNGLFHPFSARMADYKRARLLNNYVLQHGRDTNLYLSFVNFSFFGEEGDVFGNVLAVLLGLADAKAAKRTLDALTKAQVGNPYPVRAVTRPIKKNSSLWRPYMARHRQNLVWQYHNGGIWPMVGGFWIMALAAAGRRSQARAELVKLARVCALSNWSFTEWLHGKTLAPRGMPGQSWNAAAFLMAQHALVTRERIFAAG